MAEERIRVVSVPSHHPYVSAVTDPDAVERISDRLGEHASGPEPVAWQPSPALDAAWIREHAPAFDLVHVHFGFEGIPLGDLEEFVRALSDCGKGLVLTVHDLENPQLPLAVQEDYRARLGVLVRAAREITTLTPGAAAEVRRRWGRPARVVVHPPLLEEPAEAPSVPAAPGSPLRAGILLKDARPSVDLAVVERVARAMGEDPGAWRLEVLHQDRVRPGREDEVRAIFRVLADEAAIDVRGGPRLTDRQLHEWLIGLDWLVLPYGHGTHSGLLELANDLGTRVLVTDRGHLSEQRPEDNLVLGPAAQDLSRALSEAASLPPLPPSGARALAERRRRARAEHVRLYRGAAASLPAGNRPEAPLDVLVLVGIRYRLAQPHQGGLESHVWSLVRQLRARGHRVVLSAPEGSDFLENTPPELVHPRWEWPAGVPRTDAVLPPEAEDLQTRCLRRAMDHVAAHPGDYDVVHQHTLSPEPLLRAREAGVPVVTTLHTPPLPELARAAQELRDEPGVVAPFLTVSEHNAHAWAEHGVRARTVHNGVDPDRWSPGPGGPGLCWFGRIVPEKAPHLALLAARRLGMPLRLVGPVGDPEYFRARVEPLLRADPRAQYLGPMSQEGLSAVVGSSACTLVTPVWEEPFGQVVVESLACGTPVAALARGAVGDVFHDVDGVALVPAEAVPEPSEDRRPRTGPGTGPEAEEEADVVRLAEAAEEAVAAQRDPLERAALRAGIREEALARFSFARTVEALEQVYAEAVRARQKAAGGSR